MSIDDHWAGTEECLLREADSLGELLERLGGSISPALIGGPGWERLVERARGLPVTLAAFPFGFELPLHKRAPDADFGVSLIGGSRSAAFYADQGRSRGASPAAAGIAGLLTAMEPADSLLRRVAGRKMLLEYDMDASGQGEHPDPGIFLYPDAKSLLGDGTRFGDAGVMLDAIADAAGRALPDDERRATERVYLALMPETGIRSVGTFPARGRSIRLAMTGFRTAADVTAFLSRAGWPGECSAAGRIVSRLEQRGAFAYAGVHFDMGEGGVGPKLGLSFFAQEAEWLKDVRHWKGLIDAMGEEPIVVPEKLSALAETSSGAQTLFGRSGAILLLRGIHHIKLVLSGDGLEQVKAYVFMLVMARPG